MTAALVAGVGIICCCSGGSPNSWCLIQELRCGSGRGGGADSTGQPGYEAHLDRDDDGIACGPISAIAEPRHPQFDVAHAKPMSHKNARGR